MSTNHEPDLIAGLPAVTDADLAALHDRLVREAGAAGLLDVGYRTLDTPVGPLLLAATEDGLVRIAFASEGHDQVLESLAARVSPRILRAPGRLDEAAREIDEYFSGRRRRFDLPLDFRLSTGFRRIVLGHLPVIDYGKTVSYAQLASDVGSPRAFRAVGTACATNPLPVVVPCHRVVKTGGELGNYRGGPDAKRFLIDLEAA
jgi:methylated-DNA-[protein]-cysteine S-methyltransferase